MPRGERLDFWSKPQHPVEFGARIGLPATAPGGPQRPGHHRQGVIGVGAVIGGGDGLTRDAADTRFARVFSDTGQRLGALPGIGNGMGQRERPGWIDRRNPVDLGASMDGGHRGAVGHQLAAQIGGHADLVAS